MHKKTSTTPIHPIRKKIFAILTYIIPLLFMYWFFFVLLPSQIDVAQLKETISGLSGTDFFVLLIAGLASILAVGWTAATVLPGIKVRKATQASVVSQLTAVILPPPADMAIRFGMYKTYGFPVDKSAVAVVLSGVARYFTVVIIPILGLFAMIIAGQGGKSAVVWLILGTSVVAFALWIMRQILISKKTALKAGTIIQNIVNWLRKLFHKKPVTDIAAGAVDFGQNSKDVALNHFWPIAVSNVVWGISCYVILLLAVRFCGIDSSIMSPTYLLYITGIMLLLNSMPIPGSGAGVTEAILLTNMYFPTPQVQAAFTAALLLYRAYTWLLPFPIGGVAYFTWRYQIRNRYKHSA